MWELPVCCWACYNALYGAGWMGRIEGSESGGEKSFVEESNRGSRCQSGRAAAAAGLGNRPPGRNFLSGRHGSGDGPGHVSGEPG